MKNFFLLLCLLVLGTMACKQKDPCADTICQRGVCVDGTCECPNGYKGVDCAEISPPRFMRLKSIRVLSFPTKRKDGSNWDLLDGPDMYLKLENQSGSTTIWRQATTDYFKNAKQGSNYIAYISTAVDLLPTTTYSLLMYDDDPTTVEYMGGIDFQPFKYNFTPLQKYVCTNCDVSFEIEWDFIF